MLLDASPAPHRPVRIPAGIPADWAAIEPLPPLVRTTDGSATLLATRVRVAWDGTLLHVRFDCADPDPWWTLERRDAALWEEEVVELFLARGAEAPRSYAEFEVNPGGVLFDAWIDNPDGRRETMRIGTGWDCAGIAWCAGIAAEEQRWWAELAIPLAEIARGRDVLGTWRANFYRIERPRPGDPEYSAWSPTLGAPAEFHRPARFGILVLE